MLRTIILWNISFEKDLLSFEREKRKEHRLKQNKIPVNYWNTRNIMLNVLLPLTIIRSIALSECEKEWLPFLGQLALWSDGSLFVSKCFGSQCTAVWGHNVPRFGVIMYGGLGHNVTRFGVTMYRGLGSQCTEVWVTMYRCLGSQCTEVWVTMYRGLGHNVPRFGSQCTEVWGHNVPRFGSQWPGAKVEDSFLFRCHIMYLWQKNTSPIFHPV